MALALSAARAARRGHVRVPFPRLSWIVLVESHVGAHLAFLQANPRADALAHVDAGREAEDANAVPPLGRLVAAVPAVAFSHEKGPLGEASHAPAVFGETEYNARRSALAPLHAVVVPRNHCVQIGQRGQRVPERRVVSVAEVPAGLRRAVAQAVRCGGCHRIL